MHPSVEYTPMLSCVATPPQPIPMSHHTTTHTQALHRPVSAGAFTFQHDHQHLTAGLGCPTGTYPISDQADLLSGWKPSKDKRNASTGRPDLGRLQDRRLRKQLVYHEV